MRNISDEEIETFWRDGVVCLRSAVSREWVELVAQAMEDWLASPQRFDLTQYGEDVAQMHGARRPHDCRERAARRPHARGAGVPVRLGLGGAVLPARAAAAAC